MTWKWPFFFFFCFVLLFYFLFLLLFLSNKSNEERRNNKSLIKNKKNTEEKKIQLIGYLRKTKNKNVGWMKRGTSVLSSPHHSHLYTILHGSFLHLQTTQFFLFYFPSYFPNNVTRKTKNPRDGQILLDTMKSRKWYFGHRWTC